MIVGKEKKVQEFIGKDFLLTNETAKRLYHEHAAGMPIFDYHCHLSEKEIERDEPFEDFFTLWLGGDHYKWRLMRNFGIDERFITGDASHKEKFEAYVCALERAYGNPLYHWSHMELRAYFGIEERICTANADAVWEKANGYIRSHRLSPASLIAGSNVRTVCTTNEIFDDLRIFGRIREKGYPFRVLPTFRADKVMNIDDPAFAAHLGKLCALTGELRSLDELEEAIVLRVGQFRAAGAVAADIALQRVYPPLPRKEAAQAFAAARRGEPVSEAQAAAYKSFVTQTVMRACAAKGLAVQLHIGAMRNNNSRMFARLGADTGYDSIDDGVGISALARLMDVLDGAGELPKTVLFNLNPAWNLPLTTLAGCFQDASARGKIQFGPAWWFLDHLDGIRAQLDALAATGHIATFIGMLTDSRSFLSYPRHHYFRRILCDWLGRKAEAGEIGYDFDAFAAVVRDICYNNAAAYFGADT